MDNNVTWFSMTIGEQISNIGSEVSRAIRWKNKNDNEKKINFCKKALEFIDLTEQDPKNAHRKSELDFCKEELIDYFLGENKYNTTDEMLKKYYDAFLSA